MHEYMIQKHGLNMIPTEIKSIQKILMAMKNGMTEDIMNLYYKLNEFGCVLQYTRSGRIAVTRSTQEEVSEFIEQREKNI